MVYELFDVFILDILSDRLLCLLHWLDHRFRLLHWLDNWLWLLKYFYRSWFRFFLVFKWQYNWLWWPYRLNYLTLRFSWQGNRFNFRLCFNNFRSNRLRDWLGLRSCFPFFWLWLVICHYRFWRRYKLLLGWIALGQVINYLGFRLLEFLDWLDLWFWKSYRSNLWLLWFICIDDDWFYWFHCSWLR